MTLQSREEKISEIRQNIIIKLELTQYLNEKDFTLFCVKLTNYLKYYKNCILLEKTDREIKTLLDNMIIFFENLGFKKRKIISCLLNNFSLIEYISRDDFLYKYILLSVLENDKNEVRKKLLLEDSEVFNKSLEEIYVRYVLLKKTDREVTITNLLKTNFSKFIDSFIVKGYLYDPKKKIFKEKKTLAQLIEMFPIDKDYIYELMRLPRNRNVTFNRQLSTDEKRRLAIKNYQKVSNISELSMLLNISKSSLQRYLREDSKKITSKEEYKRILEWLKNAKEEGTKKGGKVSQELHDFAKDEMGKFSGSGRKK